MENWYRIIFLYILLHVISFIVEVYRYKHSNWNLKFFIKDEMMTMTYILLIIDALVATVIVIVWAVKPLNG